MLSLTSESVAVLQQHWPVGAVQVVSLHQSVSTRVVAHIRTSAGELAVKVDARPHRSVIGGELVQEQVAVSASGLAPAPLPTSTGSLAVTAGGLRYTVSEWVRGRPPADDPETWGRIGRALARLHGLPVVERPFAIPVSGMCREIDAQPDWPPALVGEVVDRARRITPGAPAVVHGQPSPANMVQRPGGDVTLLDWDESGTGPPVLDLGYPLITAFLGPDSRWRTDQAAAFYRGYRDHASHDLPATTDVFAAALLLGLRSAMFADARTRLRRVRYALDHEDTLTRVLAGAT